MRVLFIARYHGAHLHRKVELLDAEPDLELWVVYPRFPGANDWLAGLASQPGRRGRVRSVAMIGSVVAPHRSLYQTVDFGLAQVRPDLVHVEEEPDSLAGLQVALARRVFAPRVPLVFYTWQNQPRPLRWEVRQVLRQTLRASSVILCANQEAPALLRRHGFRGPTPVIPANGVDLRLFRPAAGAPEAGAFTIGYAGRLVPEKGLDTLIDAVAQLAHSAPVPLRLRLVGSGPARAALEALVQARGLAAQTRFMPSVPPAELARQLCELDVLVLPSRTTPKWKEQFGRVLTEAMACRVPVVGSDSGAIPEVIGDAGLVFREGDAPALAAGLQALLNNPAQRAALAERGFARVHSLYTQEIIAARTAEVYRRLAAPAASAGAER
jgi:glycosyltransferase involved in cell wall biosynthesis